MNRITAKSYSAAAADSVTYCYDGDSAGSCTGAPSAGLLKGRLTLVKSGNYTTTYTGFDGMGRVTGSSQQFGTETPLAFSYTYNKASGLEEERYPSGRRVVSCYDRAGRAKQAKDGASTTFSWASGAQFEAHGGLKQLTLGNGVVHSWEYNGRLQMQQAKAVKGPTTLLQLDLRYCAGETANCADNAGNLISQRIQHPDATQAAINRLQTYGYDALSRLKSMNEAGTGLSQTYDYDRWGNRALTAGWTPYGDLTPQVLTAFDTSRNRVLDQSYDNRGNLLTLPSRQYTYDGESRLKTATDSLGTNAQYKYDGEGRRVEKISGAAVTRYVYDAMGKLVAEYGAANQAGTQYVTADHLGSTRLVTDGSGNVVRRIDYTPFGEEVASGHFGRDLQFPAGSYPGMADVAAQKFTGKERDSETGLDYFGARYFGGAQGRFTTPDPLMASAKTSNPQTWNRYTYGLNNPLRFTDPTGLYTCEGTADQCKQFEKTRAGLLKSKDSAAVNAGKAYGKAGENNGVVVRFADKLPDRGGTVTPVDSGIRSDPRNPERIQANLLVRIQSGNIGNAETIAHEGSHVADYQAFAESLSIANQWGDQTLNITHMETEVRAYNLSIRLATQGNQTTNFGPCGLMTECKFPPGQMPAQRDELIKQLLTHPGSIYKNLDKVLYPAFLKPRQE